MLEWKVISGFSNYKVSTYGNIMNHKGKLIRGTIDEYGYLKVGITDDNKKFHVKSIHRLVAIAFIDNNESKRDVNHKDGDKLNNNLSNLEWMTSRENTKHYVQVTKGKIRHGVSYDKGKRKYRAIIYFNKARTRKWFRNEEDAYKWYYETHKEIAGIYPW